MAENAGTGKFLIDDPTSEPGNEPEGGGKEYPTQGGARLAGFAVVTPGESFSDSGSESGSSEPRRRGGRPRGSKNAPRGEGQAKTASNIAENLERLLVSVHAMGSVFLACPELELDATEAEKLSVAIREVSKHYTVTLDPKRLALYELMAVAVMIYGTRGVAIYRRLTVEPKPKPHAVPTPIRATATTGPVADSDKPTTPSETIVNGSGAATKPRAPEPPVPHQWFGVDNQESESQL